jgi:hypothetical protein
MGVKMTRNDAGEIELSTPFHPSVPPAARDLGGKWIASREVWTFDPRDESNVREMVRRIFGTDGSDQPRLVTVMHRVTSRESQNSTLWFCGREVAQRPVRDARVRLGTGVRYAGDAQFPGSGGSAKYPALNATGLVLEIRDVPVELAVAAVNDDTWIVDDVGPVEPVGESDDPLAGTDDAVLVAEMERRGYVVSRR